MGAAAVSRTTRDPKVPTPNTSTASIVPAVLNLESDEQIARPDVDNMQREQSYHSRPGKGAASSKERKMLNKC